MPETNDIENLRELLAQYRRTLRLYLQQRAALGAAYIPPGIANGIDLVVGCVDTRGARATIHQSVTTTWCGTMYWLDLGNNADSGQFVLGQPLNRVNRRKAARLRTVSELFGEIVDSAA